MFLTLGAVIAASVLLPGGFRSHLNGLWSAGSAERLPPTGGLLERRDDRPVVWVE